MSHRAPRVLHRLVTFALVVVVLLAGSACTDTELGYEIGPVAFSIGTDGKIDVELGQRLVTPIGVFSVRSGNTVGLDEALAQDKAGPGLLVIIRQTVDGELRDSVFEVRTGQRLRLELDGEVLQEFEPGRVLVKPQPGATLRIRPLESIEPTPAAKPVYRVLHQDVLLNLPDPLRLYGFGIDVDTATASTDVGSSDADLVWEYGRGLQPGFGSVSWGTTDAATASSPDGCATDAAASAEGVDAEDLRAGDLFCVSTSAGNVARLTVLDVTDPPGRPGRSDRATVRLRATVWTLTTALVPAVPLESYRIGYEHTILQLPDPIGEYGLGADLDEALAGSGIDSDDRDLSWDYGRGLGGGYGSVRFGFTDHGPDVAPGDCAADARSRAAGTVDAEALEVGQTFCVITTESNVAHVRITKRTGVSDRPALALEVTLWLNDLAPEPR
jgi:hypothetical protein